MKEIIVKEREQQSTLKVDRKDKDDILYQKQKEDLVTHFRLKKLNTLKTQATDEGVSEKPSLKRVKSIPFF